MAGNQAPFVMKLRFYLPQGKNKDKNAAHVAYIDRGAKRTEQEDDEAVIHARYMGERRGSAGLFGGGGGESAKNVQRELRKHNGIVWRFILSLREEDAKRLGHNTREDWERAIKLSVSEAAAKMGIDALNLRWVAAFHNTPGHPHAHLMLWEKHVTVLHGVLDDTKFKGVRRAFVNRFYGEERRRLLAERTALRDSVREAAVAILVTGKARAERPCFEELERRLVRLSRLMPGRGRVNLAFMPPETKAAARDVATWLLDQDELRELKDQYLERSRGLTRHHTLDEDKIKEAAERAQDDLRDRVAQVILRAAAQIPDIPEQAQAVRDAAAGLLTGLASVRRVDAGRGEDTSGKALKTLGEEKYLRHKLKERTTMER
jgi:hypothetical protein